jgi:hypothetical protein
MLLFISLQGDFSPAVAVEGPDLDEFVASFEASPGYFNTYKTPAGRLYFEVTEDHFNQDFLVVVQIAKGVGQSFMLTGLPVVTEMMTFRMRNQKIELITRNPTFRADDGTPAARMVDLGFQDSVRQSFMPVANKVDEGRYLIDVSGLFVSDWASLSSVLPGVYGTGFFLDRSRSELVSAKGFPENVEVAVDLTYGSASPFNSAVLPDSRAVPLGIHYSVRKLPEEPMKPRYADDRIGYFTTTYKDYTRDQGPSDMVRIVNRWRLEKKDPFAALSDPVKPITFYLENTIPTELLPYIREGVEAWNTAFEKAGFTNAIQALDQPADPDWDAGDARYSTIRWMPSPFATFAIGPSDVDPRSGEVLNADILFAAEWVRVLVGQDDVFIENALSSLREDGEEMQLARLLNPDVAERLCTYGSNMASELEMLRYTLMADGIIEANGELPIEYIGEILREITMHEVGHTLTLRHNFKGSTSIPNEHLHDQAYTATNGVSASVMDYLPPNISVDRSAQGDYTSLVVGTYDQWAIQWGYTQVGNETVDPHADLQAIAQLSNLPEHVYGTDEDGGFGPFAMDPHINTWDLGAEPMVYYQGRDTLINGLWSGLEDRLIMEDGVYWPLRNATNVLLQQKFLGRWYFTKALGGVNMMRTRKGSGDVPMQAIPAEYQRESLAFVQEVFTTEFLQDFPKEMLDKLSIDRQSQYGFANLFQRFTYPIVNQVTAMRVFLLNIGLNPERLMRIRDNEFRSDDANPYTLGEHFTGFTDAVWGGVLLGQAPEDMLQREIQSSYLDLLIQIATSAQSVGQGQFGFAAPTPYIADAKSLAFAELLRLHEAISAKIAAGGSSRVAEAHLLEAQHRIERSWDTN